MTENELPPLARDILTFWFGGDPASPLANRERWFKQNDDFDREVRERFAGPLEEAAGGAFTDWPAQPRGALAYIILIDQFSRNIHRDDPRAFAADPLALQVSQAGLARGQDAALPLVQRWFFTLPLMHSEDLAHQDLSLEKILALAVAAEGEGQELQEVMAEVLVFAAKHREVIARFGRFPHRNAVLGRENTPEELKFLKEQGKGF